MVCIAILQTRLNLQIFNYAEKRRICHENSKYAPDESFVAIFALAERLPTCQFVHLQDCLRAALGIYKHIILGLQTAQ